MKTEKIPLETLILDVLEKELNNGDNFLNDSQIARRATGLSCQLDDGRESPIAAKSVRDRMPRVREVADEKGMTIIALRIKDLKEPAKDSNGRKIIDPVTKKTKLVSTNSKSLKVVGWKIASKNNEDYIINELELRTTMRNGFEENRIKISSTAKKKGLLPPNELPQLGESI